MLSSGEGSNRAVMSDIRASLTFEVFFDDEGRERIESGRWWIRRDELGGGEEGLRGRGRTRSGCGRGKEGGELVQLDIGELLHAELVVELQPGHDLSRGAMVDSVKGEQSDLILARSVAAHP